jgi:phosphoenolpyruvate carboxylase
MKRIAYAVSGLLLCWVGAAASAAEQAWIQRSNEHAQVLLQVLAQFSPETAAQIGVEGFDTEVADLKPKVFERSQKATRKAVDELKARLKRETDANVRQDLEIMIATGEDNLRSSELANEHLLPYSATSRLVFQGLKSLLDPRISKERQARAVDRLRRYAGLERGYEPIAELAKARTKERFRDKELIGPYRGEVEQHLADSPR